MLHRVPDEARLVQTKSSTWFVEAPVTGLENSVTARCVTTDRSTRCP
jgi:hypothetical protein